MRHLLVLALVGCGRLAAAHPTATPAAPWPVPTVVVCDGDSQTAGNHASDRSKAYPEQLAALSGWKTLNLGRPGITTEGMLEDARSGADRADLFYEQGGVLLAWGGINSYPADTPAAAFAATKSYLEERLAKGWRVGALTLVAMDYQGTAAAYDAWRAEFNRLLSGLPGVRIFDVAALPAMHDAHDGAFNPDAQHLSDAGYLEIARYVFGRMKE